MKLGRVGRCVVGFVSFSRVLFGLGLGLALLYGEVAAAQECPFGYPVDCGSYCCESGAYCQDGGCYASINPPPDPGGGSCPAGYPVDCGGYCCESGAYCQDGGCYASNDPPPDPGGGSCPAGYPVDCGGYCCESGAYCQDGGCYASNDPPDPGGSTCPDGYPVDCGTFCCSSGASCGANETCLASSTTDEYVDAVCPDGYPVDCGSDYCCPSGSTCTVQGCLGSGGSPIDGSELICASQIIDTQYGGCNLDFCIANSNGGCESYYIVNGEHIFCSGCAADAACIQVAGEACAGQGVSSEPYSPSPSSPGSDECCGSSDTCGWANDGVCDCSRQYANSWDAADCADEDYEPEICSVGEVGASNGAAGVAFAFAVVGLALTKRRRSRR